MNCTFNLNFMQKSDKLSLSAVYSRPLKLFPFMSTIKSLLCQELIALKTKCQQLQRLVNNLTQQVNYWKYHAAHRAEQINQLKKENKQIQAKLNLRERQLFSRKSETSSSQQQDQPSKSEKQKKKRGRPKGSQGHGRRDHPHLPIKEDFKEIPLDDRLCPCCGLAYEPFGDSEDSEIIEIEVKAHRRIIKRQKYKKVCTCPNQPGIMTAPSEPRLIPKGKLGISIRIELLLDKFCAMNPTHRLLAQWKLLGLDIPLSAVTNGLKRIEPMLQPIYGAIVEHNRQQNRWHADETRWQVFAEVEGKIGYRWYLWVFAAESSIVYVLDQSRSAKVPQAHFGIVAAGILNVDRFSSYKALGKTNVRIILAFCWAHVRRDFIAVAKDWPDQEEWGMSWVEDIGQIYHLNKQRLAVLNQTGQWTKSQAELEQAIDQMAKRRDSELADDNCHPARKKTLNSLKNHWDGLTIFVDNPDVPMDNNKAERLIRKPVIGRKNFYGSSSLWSGQLLAVMLTIIQTLLCWNINPRLWLTKFLTACAENDGQILNNIAAFLPWNMTEEQRRHLTAPKSRSPNTS